MLSMKEGVYLRVERVVLNKIESIERCVKRLDEIYAGDEKRLGDYLYQDALILNIQRACQQSIDLAMYLSSKLGLGIPKNSREAFTFLGDAEILSKEVALAMEKMVGFRNIVVHEYQEVELKVVKFSIIF